MLRSLNILYAKGEDLSHRNMIEALEFMSMNVKIVSDGDKAYREYQRSKPDIIISDVEIPILNGLELVEKIRQEDNDIQIIILTKCTELPCLLKAVELNITKYLLKNSTSFNDLKNALMICIENISKKKTKLLKHFNKKDHYDLNRQVLYVNDKVVRLDYHERDFLELLLKNDPKIVTYKEIENQVWDNKMSSAAIRSLVRNLRKKLPSHSIENISKVGYRVVTSNG